MTDRLGVRSQAAVGKVMSAEDAAALIVSGSTIRMSGFTGAGYPKAVPGGAGERIAEMHARGGHFTVDVWTGASTAPELDGRWRRPTGSICGCRTSPTR